MINRCNGPLINTYNFFLTDCHFKETCKLLTSLIRLPVHCQRADKHVLSVLKDSDEACNVRICDFIEVFIYKFWFINAL